MLFASSFTDYISRKQYHKKRFVTFTSTLVFWGSVGVVLGRFGYWLIVE